MTPKLYQVHKMLLYTALFLLVTLIKKSHGFFRVEPVAELQLAKVHRSLLGIAEIAPDILDDNHFVVGLSDKNSQSLAGLSVKTIAPYNNTKNECFVPVMLATNSSAFPIRRLSHKSVLLVTVFEGDKKNELKLVLLNTNNCKYSDIYNGVLPESHYIFSSDDPTDEKFTLIMYGKNYCRGHNWCRVFFDPLYRKFESLNFDFAWKKYDVDIEPAFTFDANTFVTRFTDAHNIYRIRMYNMSNTRQTIRYQDLFSIRADNTREDFQKPFRIYMIHPYVSRYYYYDSQENVRSSGLSYCWQRNRISTFMACDVYRQDGSMMFRYPMFTTYDSRILHVKSIPNGLILFSKIQECFSRGFTQWKMWQDCQLVQVTLIRCNNCTNSTINYTAKPEVEMKRSKHLFECFEVEGLKVHMNDTDHSIQVKYLCNKLSIMSYHVLRIDLKNS